MEVIQNVDLSHRVRREAVVFLKSKPTSFASVVQSAPCSAASLHNVIDASVEKSVVRAIGYLIDTFVPVLLDMLS